MKNKQILGNFQYHVTLETPGHEPMAVGCDLLPELTAASFTLTRSCAHSKWYFIYLQKPFA